MKLLFFISLLFLYSCGDDEILNVFIENDSSVKNKTNTVIKYSNVSISGLIKNGAGMTIVLESPIVKNKIELGRMVIDEKDQFTIQTEIPMECGYYILRLFNKQQDSIELSLSGGDIISLNTTVKKFITFPALKGPNWSQDANNFQEWKGSIIISEKQLSEKATQMMKAKPSSPFNIVLSKYFIGSGQDINEIKIDVFHNVVNKFMDSIPNSQTAKNFIEQLDFLVNIRAKTLGIEKGEYMINNGFYDVPEISLKTPEGKDMNLSDFRGEYVLVDFWASWCGPCRKENPNVVKLYQKYRKKNFTVFSVSLDQDGTKWKQAIQKDNLIWPNHVSDLMGWNSSVVPLFNIQGIPYTILVNPEGKIIGVNLRGQELETRLQKLFKS